MRTLVLLSSLVAACGSGSSDHPDSRPVIDAPGAADADAVTAADATQTPDAGPTAPLTVIVLDALDAPIAGAEVIFANADGSLAADLVTDSTGTVVHPMAAGATITAVERVGTYAYVSTYTDLPLGATVTAQHDTDSNRVPVTLSWPAEPQMDRYEVVVTCAGNGAITAGTSATLQVDRRCAASFDAVVVARDLDTATMLAPEAQVATSVSSPVTFGASWSSLVALDARLVNIPTNLIGPLSVEALALIDADHLPTGPIGGERTLAPDGSIGAPFELPDGTTPVLAFLVPGPGGQAYRERVTTPPGAPFLSDLDGAILPWLTGVAADAATRVVTWTKTDPTGITPASADDAFVEVELDRPGIAVSWHVAMPGSRLTSTPGGGAVTLPDIPGDRDFELHAGDNISKHVVYLVAINPGANPDLIRERAETAVYDFDVFADPALTRLAASVGF